MKTINLKETIQFLIIITVIVSSIIVTNHFIKNLKHMYHTEQHPKAITYLFNIIQ